MSSNSETKDRPIRPRIQPALLTKMDIDAILFAKKIHGGIKKSTDHYKLGHKESRIFGMRNIPIAMLILMVHRTYLLGLLLKMQLDMKIIIKIQKSSLWKIQNQILMKSRKGKRLICVECSEKS